MVELQMGLKLAFILFVLKPTMFKYLFVFFNFDFNRFYSFAMRKCILISLTLYFQYLSSNLMFIPPLFFFLTLVLTILFPPLQLAELPFEKETYLNLLKPH